MENLYCRTPLIESLPLAKLVGRQVYLKLENSQPTASFKQRGMSYRSLGIFKDGYREVVTASGGNAGLALAYCARKLGMKATIVIPTATTAAIGDKLRQQGAEVHVHGSCWSEADELARKIAEETGAFHVHPFDNPSIWLGNSTLITEAEEDMPSRPCAVVVSVGGGGLFCGVVEGMKKVGWGDVPVVAMETRGAESFNASLEAGTLVSLSKIDSIATTLGALQVCPKALEYASQHSVLSEVVNDSDAVSACMKFADDHKMLVEPACGATLSAIYSGIVAKLMARGSIQGKGPVLVVVCGGSDVSLNQLVQWRKILP